MRFFFFYTVLLGLSDVREMLLCIWAFLAFFILYSGRSCCDLLLYFIFLFLSRWHSEKLTPTLKSACEEFYDPPILRLLTEKLMTRAFVLVRAYSPDCGRSIRLESIVRCKFFYCYGVFSTVAICCVLDVSIVTGRLPGYLGRPHIMTRVPNPLAAFPFFIASRRQFKSGVVINSLNRTVRLMV
jgi:hypothetical protein